jgi:DNA polymerase-3 subunit delta
MMLIASEFEKLLLYVSAPASAAIPNNAVILSEASQTTIPPQIPVILSGAHSAQSKDPEESNSTTTLPSSQPPLSTQAPLPSTAIAKNRVTLGDVETMVLAAKQRSLYELTDAISAKDRPRALLLLHGLLNASDGGEDSAIGHLYMLARTFRQMLIISEKNVRDPRAIWQVLWQGFRMPPFAAEDLIKQARRYKSRRELTRAIRLVARADLELRSSPANKLLVLERLILDLSTEPKPTLYEPSHQFAMEL